MTVNGGTSENKKKKMLRIAYSTDFVPFASATKENVPLGTEDTRMEGKVTL